MCIVKNRSSLERKQGFLNGSTNYGSRTDIVLNIISMVRQLGKPLPYFTFSGRAVNGGYTFTLFLPWLLHLSKAINEEK